MQQHSSSSFHRIDVSVRWLRLFLGSALLCVALGYLACTGTVLPFLQHFKHPMAATTVRLTENNAVRYQMYIANADINRLAVVDITQRSLVIDPNPKTLGILYVPTGNRPVDVATSPDQKRIYVLHATDGNIRIYDTASNQPLNNNPMIPTNCARQPGCWSGAIRLLLYPQQNPSQLLGFVALAGENAIAIVNLNEADSANFGKEISRIRLSGRPGDMWFGPDQKTIYVADPTQPFVHVVEAETQSVRSLAVSAPNLTGSTSLDNKWLYLIDARDNTIMIYDLINNKMVSQGDERFPKETNIRIASVSFLQVKFLPPISILVRNKDGNDRVLTKSFAWANASDGHGYLIDPDEYTNQDNSITFKAHRLLDSDEGGPTVANIKVAIGETSYGDPRQPVRTFIPRLATSSTNESGVEVVHGKTNTETWTLTYEGQVVKDRSGRFTDNTGTFADIEQKDLPTLGVKVKDLLILQDCGTITNLPDAGQTADEAPPVPTCELEIKQVDGYRVVVDTSKLPTGQQAQAQWTYSIRAAQSYTVVGSITGLLPSRIIENVLFSTDAFLLTLEKNKEATLRDTTITFDTASGINFKRLKMGGLPTVIVPQANHVSCGGALCSVENCKTHPSCTNIACVADTEDATKRCGNDETCTNGACQANTKLWILDPAGGRLFIINPKDNITLETTLR